MSLTLPPPPREKTSPTAWEQWVENLWRYVTDIRLSRQVEVGTANTTSLSTTSASFADITAPKVTITFTAERTATYRVMLQGIWYSNTAATRTGARLNASAGSPTLVYLQEAHQDFAAGTVNVATPFLVWGIWDLTADTSYTFDLQVRTSGGTATVRNDIPTNGVKILAEELS